jgi:hypothetical protein
MRIREVICKKRWFLKKSIEAITLYPFIFFHGEPTNRTRSHEYIHVAQVRRIGWLKFYILYFWYNFKLGYLLNPFEIEAREGEQP